MSVFGQPDAVAFTLGGLVIRWYALVLVLAILAGTAVTNYAFQKKQVPREHLPGLLFWSLVAGVIGGRIGHVLAEWAYFGDNPGALVRVWEGGLAIHGVVSGVVLVVIAYSRIQRLPFWRVAGVVAVAAPLMQAIGRWGNYFNQELFGRPTNVPWGIPIDPALRPERFMGSEYFHPVFLYESLAMLAVFGLMLWLLSKKQLPEKALVGWYLIFFGIVRFGLDFLRIEHPMWGPLLVTQWISVFLVVAGVWLTLSRSREQPVT